MQDHLFTAFLIAAGVLVVAGVADFSDGLAKIVAGVLVGVLGWLILGDVQ